MRPLIQSHATLTVAILTLFHSSAAAAQDSTNEALLATAGSVAFQTCDGIQAGAPELTEPDLELEDKSKWRVVSSKRAAYFLASHSGEMVTPTDAVGLVRSLDGPTTADRPKGHKHLKDVLYHFQSNLAANKWGNLRAFDNSNKPIEVELSAHNRAWITRPEVILRCKLPPEAKAPQVVVNGKVTKESKPAKLDWRLRGDVDALAAEGEERQAASAASFGYSRTRTYQDDGSRTQATEYAVKAVLGVVLDHRPNRSLVVFGGYELKQNRANPTPALVPPATVRDGDTEIITLGASFSRLVPIDGKDNPYATSLTFRFDGTYKFDLVKNSERIEGKFSTSLYRLEPVLGFCSLGGLHDFGNGFWSRCEATGIASYNVITRQGRLPVTAKDHYAHIGGKASVSFYFGDPSESAAFASAQYLNMARIDGDPIAIPSIRQHKFSVGYRWWTGSRLGIEVKSELTDGINPDGLVNENALKLGFGIIF